MPRRFAVHRPDRLPRSRRLSAARRGYGTSWQAMREAAYRALPYRCAVCGNTERLHLDHKTPRERGGGDELSNLQWLCPSCHSRKTATTDGGFGNAMKM